jgi:hypothetical protein
MKKKYFIYYINGQFETVDSFNMTFLHMVEMGVIRIIFDVEANKAWLRNEEGIAKEVVVTNVSGL